VLVHYFWKKYLLPPDTEARPSWPNSPSRHLFHVCVCVSLSVCVCVCPCLCVVQIVRIRVPVARQGLAEML
jgi:hypothetical protein